MRLLWRPAGGAAMPSTDETRAERLEFVKQEGREIFKQAVMCMEEACRRVLDATHQRLQNRDTESLLRPN